MLTTKLNIDTEFLPGFRLLVEEIFSLPEVAALMNRAADQQEGG